jgi:cell division protease FtsH
MSGAPVSLFKRRDGSRQERRAAIPVHGDLPSRRPPRRALLKQPRFLATVAVLIAVYWTIVLLLSPHEPSVKVPYSPVFLNEVRAGNVERINSRGAQVTGEFREAVTWPREDDEDHDPETATKFETALPAFTDAARLERLLLDKGVQIDADPISARRGLFATLLLVFGPVLLFVVLLVYILRRGGPVGAIGSFGRSRARRFEPTRSTITFDDVAGIEEAKEELTEVVDFLKSPDRYRALGGRVPRGVLLTGEPGTGKTLLARAVAGEAGVPFFSSSASEFVEAVVGVGAARVRDTFNNAKKAAPAILFVDELDAVGRKRSGGAGFGAGSDEREQTLNQILTEMDGFDSRETVIVLGATNRPDTLDSALLRPGRFDRRVTVPAPDVDGRRAILEVHTRAVALDAGVDVERLAAITPGMVGADLANLCNEAALMAARRRHDVVMQHDFLDALEKIVLGAPRSILLSDEDLRRTAFHEAGHAVVGMLTPGADPVRKVSIIPRGRALGVTFSAPDADRVHYDRAQLRARLDVAYGGRVAEELAFDDVTTGAENDVEQVTELARSMVGRWGMSDRIGFLAVLPRDNGTPFARAPWSDATQEAVDAEVRRIVEESHDRVRRLLSEHRDRLEALVVALLEHETLDQEAAYAAAGIAPAPTPAPRRATAPSAAAR